jgi:XTP/dITP diphosphohydrolase
MSFRLLLGTHNRGKRREWQALLEGLDVEILLPDEMGLTLDVKETGQTYTENALLKARTYVGIADLPTLADDSGLEVDALDGAPGIRSARYTLGSDRVRYRALLKALEDVPPPERMARFRCIAALVLPDGRQFTTEGVCEGIVTMAPSGDGGFGYDPIFYVPSHGRTMAELSAETKNYISHRARAARALRPILTRIIAES